MTSLVGAGRTSHSPSKMLFEISWWSLAILLPVSLVGCGAGGNKDGLPVHGSVMIEGEPVKSAKIKFVARGETKSEATTAVVNGKFEFAAGYGPAAGEHDVLIYYSPPDFEELQATIQEGQDEGMFSSELPEAYARAGLLVASVSTDATNPIEFSLKANP